MKSVYFVSFSWASKSETGFGRTVVDTLEPITRDEQLDEIEYKISASHELRKVTIINYQFLRTEE